MKDLDDKSPRNNQVAIKKLTEKMDKEAKAQGLSSAMELMAKQDPAMADIMARMLKAEIDNKEPRPWCEKCTVAQQHSAHASKV